MRLYIAGPMTWHPQYNYPAFFAMKDALAAAGYTDVVSPAELDDPADREAAMASETGDPADYTGPLSWGDFLARDVKLLADDGIEGIVVLDGWGSSRGARLETFVANALCGLPIYRLVGDTLMEIAPITLFKMWTQEPGLLIYRKPFSREVEA